jgi:hypothetical protein
MGQAGRLEQPAWINAFSQKQHLNRANASNKKNTSRKTPEYENTKSNKFKSQTPPV